MAIISEKISPTRFSQHIVRTYASVINNTLSDN